MIHAGLGDLAAAEEHLHLALDIPGPDRRRARAIVLADLFQVQLKRDDVDHAETTWSEFLDCAEWVQSVRTANVIGNPTARLSAAAGHPDPLICTTVRVVGPCFRLPPDRLSPTRRSG
jgi:hypothetical protein